MKINTSNAAKLFFPNSSLEMIYFEAIANSIDANADLIEIKITIDSYSKPDSLQLEIIDNGDGFLDTNFNKFAKLLEINSEDHKGLGRLVFLNYFDKVEIASSYGTKSRAFVFSDSWDEKSKVTESQNDENKTILKFQNYKLEKVKKYDYLKPASIKQSLLLNFYPKFYKRKLDGKELTIKISLTTNDPNPTYDFYTDSAEIKTSQIPVLKTVAITENTLDLFEKIELFYSIKETNDTPSVITAICVDDRSIPMEILSKGNLPFGYELIFILYSNLFIGKVNASRQELTFDEISLRTVKKMFADKVTEILNQEIPKIQEQNTKTIEILEEVYPHLKGYFIEKPVGLIDRNESLQIAQQKFFNDQKEILEAQSLTDEQYEKSLTISSRILMEYILYRNLIIGKLKKIDHSNSEDDIHNVIVPMRKSFHKDTYINDLYTNNAWLLDDKYMSYTTILSDQQMEKLISNISLEEDVQADSKRPDIAIVFSNDPVSIPKVDVVIVELKKLGLSLERKNDIVVQLIRRATKLLHLYPNKIQRIWFYGIVDIDLEFKLLLKGLGFTELFSNDSVLYKPQDIYLDENTKIPIGIYIQSYDAFIEDAESRNSTFLNLLKEGLKKT